MEKIKINYHTHTYRCGHALGTDESYVEGALELGLKELGFSDHISFKGYEFPKMRQSRLVLNDYVNSISSLKEKYKDQIKIHIGFEAEYIEGFLDDYKDLLKNKDIEYLICGQHCYLENDQQVFYNSCHHSVEAINKYCDAVCKAIESGLFTYIVHPDHYMNGYREWDEAAIKVAKRIFEEAIKYNVPLEINVAGLRFAEFKHRKNAEGRPIENLYPYPQFWELASHYKDLKVIIGIDAHRKEDFLDGIEQEALAFAHQYGINPLDKLELKKIE